MDKIIRYKGVEFYVNYDYQPNEENSTGIKEMIEIKDIKHKGVCFLELLENQIEEIERIVLKSYKNGRN